MAKAAEKTTPAAKKTRVARAKKVEAPVQTELVPSGEGGQTSAEDGGERRVVGIRLINMILKKLVDL